MRNNGILVSIALVMMIFFYCLSGVAAAEESTADYTLRGVDLSGATDKQKKIIFDILKSFSCPCWSGNLLECRNSAEQECEISKNAAVYIRDKITAGESPEEISKLVKEELNAVEIRLERRSNMLAGNYDIDTSGAYSMGKPDARLHLVIFSDLECQFCIKAHKMLDEIVSEFPDDLRITFMHFPLSVHAYAVSYAMAVEAAGKQGKFFEMASLIVNISGDYSEEKLIGFAGELGLDIDKFNEDMKDEEMMKKINSNKLIGMDYGIKITPTMILNKKLVERKFTIEYFRDLFNRTLKELE